MFVKYLVLNLSCNIDNYLSDVKKLGPSDTKNGEGSSSSTQVDSAISLSGSASEDSERTPGGRTDSLDGDPLQRAESAKWPRQNSVSTYIEEKQMFLVRPKGTNLQKKHLI